MRLMLIRLLGGPLDGHEWSELWSPDAPPARLLVQDQGYRWIATRFNEGIYTAIHFYTYGRMETLPVLLVGQRIFIVGDNDVMGNSD